MGVIDQIRDRLDIVDLIARYVPLTQAGSRFRARCPFHEERTPSFFVFPDQQRWRCFGGCATGGDAFNFVMKVENLEFRDALSFLARMTGLELVPKNTAETGEPLSPINHEAAKFFHDALLNDPEAESARSYLVSRGVTRESVELFMLGYSPQKNGALRSHLKLLGFGDKVINESGLFTKGPDGASRELFFGRLQFPIFDAYGNIVGFGGRTLTNSNPKYLNTPKTPIFDKSSLLYGMHIAKSEIATQGTGVVVEGYMDVLTANQYGFRNVVACMGTALTQQQVNHLTGICKDVVLALDSDAAGQEATLRSLETSWKVFNPPGSSTSPNGFSNYRRVSRKIDLRIAVLPRGLDPDDLIREDPDRWSAAVSESTDLVEFLFDVLPPRYDLTTSEGKLQLTERFAHLLLAIESPSSQDKFLERLERLLGVDRTTLEDVLGLTQRALLRNRRSNDKPQTAVEGYLAPLLQAQHDPLEEYTLGLLLRGLDSEEKFTDISSDFFHRIENRELFTVWESCDTIGEIRAQIDQNLIEHLETLVSKFLPPLDSVQRKEALAHCTRRLEERYLRDLKSQEAILLSSVDEVGLDSTSMEDVLERNKRLRHLFQRQVKEN